MKPLTLPITREIYPNDWLMYQDFEKNGERITVRAFGYDRQEVLHNFRIEVQYAATHSDVPLMDEFAGWLYDMAGLLGDPVLYFFGMTIIILITLGLALLKNW